MRAPDDPNDPNPPHPGDGAAAPPPSPPPPPAPASARAPAPAAIGRWAALAIATVAATVLYLDVDRFRNPIGEKHVPLFPPGQNDFSYTYLGARAILAGVNPYHNDRPEFTHPLFPTKQYNGFKQIYPPGNILLHMPLALWKGEDWQGAARIWFHVSLLVLAALAAITWTILRRAVDAPLSPAWIPLLFVCLALNTGVGLALERGQSDVIVALLAWGAVACCLRGRPGAAIFLAIWSVSVKGYALLFAAGLGLMLLDRARLKRLLIGVALAVALLVAPLAQYLGEAARAISYRSNMFWPVWYNHGFRNAVHQIAPAWADGGRLALAAVALAATAASWIEARRAFRSGPPARQAMWLALFATTSMGTMIGYSSLSVSYNLVMVLPGALILAAGQDRLRATLALPRAAGHALGAALVATVFLLFVYRLGDSGAPEMGRGVATSAYGLVLLIAVALALALRAFRRRAGA